MCNLPAKIKICGITNISDARLALELGADLLGFNFFRPSPRFIEPQAAAQIINALSPASAQMVGLFVNAQLDFIKQTLRECPLGMLQLHGDESNADCNRASELGLAVIKALRLRTPRDIEQARRFDTPFILLDAFHKELYGGTGATFDWSWVTSVPDKKIFLAGGICPDNIKDALAVGTYGIDLCSGVEQRPGLKDPHQMKTLFEKIKQ